MSKKLAIQGDLFSSDRYIHRDECDLVDVGEPVRRGRRCKNWKCPPDPIWWQLILYGFFRWVLPIVIAALVAFKLAAWNWHWTAVAIVVAPIWLVVQYWALAYVRRY